MLVTGGGRGIGRHIALGLAEAGARVLVASRKLANCEEVVAEIARRGGQAVAREADVSREEDVAALAEWACGDLPALLVDHAHLEKKAAGTAVTLLFRYAGEAALQDPLAALANPVWEHP